MYDFSPKFQKYKDATNQIDFGSQWAEARKSSRHRGNRGANRTILIIVVILILIFLWIIDFDLSIFSNPN